MRRLSRRRFLLAAGALAGAAGWRAAASHGGGDVEPEGAGGTTAPSTATPTTSTSMTGVAPTTPTTAAALPAPPTTGQRAEPATTMAASLPALLAGLRLVSWYPSSAGWDRLWTAAPEAEIDADFAAIRAFGANAVRVIVSTYAVGYPQPAPAMVAKLHRMLQLAASHQLQVQLTLFDLWGEFTDIVGSLQWMRAILAGLSGDPRVCFVELRNEIDPTDDQALEWVSQLAPATKAMLGPTAHTVSVTSTAGSPALQRWARFTEVVDGLDFLDVHWYGDADVARVDLAAILQMAGGRPLYIGETGASSRPGGVALRGDLEAAQASYLATVIGACQSLQLPLPAPWIWRDMTELALPDVGDDPGGLYFGLLRLDGSPKPAFEVVRSAFAVGSTARRS